MVGHQRSFHSSAPLSFRSQYLTDQREGRSYAAALQDCWKKQTNQNCPSDLILFVRHRKRYHIIARLSNEKEPFTPVKVWFLRPLTQTPTPTSCSVGSSPLPPTGPRVAGVHTPMEQKRRSGLDKDAKNRHWHKASLFSQWCLRTWIVT